MVFIFDRVLQHLRAEFSSRHPVPESRTSAGSFLRVWPATVRAAERAMEWGSISKFGTQIKMIAFPRA